MGSEEEMAAVFNDALEGMVWWYNPDIILIACNTLSVVYPKTSFAKESAIKVLGIVDFGAALAYQALSKDTDSVAILLGTPVTINSGAHKKKLLKKGIESSRIVEQPCHMLESAIQVNPFSDTTRKLLRKYLAESKDKIDPKFKKVYTVFCCTHYAYSYQLFEEELQNIFSCPVNILNPNDTMSNHLSYVINSNIKQSNISAEVVSRVRIFKEEISTIGGLINKVSKKVYESLINYYYKKDLFNPAS
jgi:glutamate racemase